MATQEEVKPRAPRIMAQKKSEESQTGTVRREAGTAQKRDDLFDDSKKMWGRGEEKRRFRMDKPRGAAGARGSSGERPRTATPGQRVPWQGKDIERSVHGVTADHRPRSSGDGRQASDGQRTAAKAPWSEPRGASSGPRRPSGDRPRPFGARTTDQRSPRPEERRPGAAGREPGRDEKRSPRQAFVGKVYGTRNQGAARSSSFKTVGPKRTEERPRPSAARATDHRGPRQEERGTLAVGREPGSTEKRSWRPALPGKVYGTRNQGPARSSSFKPGGRKRTGARPSGPRPSNTRGRSGRRA